MTGSTVRNVALALGLLAPAIGRADPGTDADPLEPLDAPLVAPPEPMDEDAVDEQALEDEGLAARRARLRARTGRRSAWPKVAVSLWWDSRPDRGIAREPGVPDRLAVDRRGELGVTLWASWSTP